MLCGWVGLLQCYLDTHNTKKGPEGHPGSSKAERTITYSCCSFFLRRIEGIMCF